MMPEDEKTLVIARRTKKNLQFIYAQKRKGEDVEEFTQLLNSMLGMLICLRERYFLERTVRWEDLEEQGLGRVEVRDFPPNIEQPELARVTSFSGLINNLRHAFAHNNFDLLGEVSSSSQSRKIVGLRVWNVPMRTPAKKRQNLEIRTWEALFTEPELQKVAYLFIDYMEKTRGHELARQA